MNSAPKVNEKPLPFRIFSIRILECYANDSTPFEQGTKARFDIHVDTGVVGDSQLIIVTPDIRITKEGEEAHFFRLTVQFVFECNGLAEFIADGILTLSDLQWVTFINMAIGSTRGIMFLNNLGYSFGSAILPPVNAEAFVPLPIKLGEPEMQRPLVIGGPGAP